jgi:ABC-type nitrate/sulfonate/bicarbonate transport system substrate-binding protein
MNKKAVDAVVVSEQDAEALIKAGAVILPEWEAKGYTEQFLPRNSLVINTEFLNQQELVVEHFLNAIADAHRLINSKPIEAANILSKHIKDGSAGAVIRSSEEIARQWESKEVINMIWQDPSVTMELAKKANELGAIDKELTTEDVFDLRFEDKLKAAQKEIYGQ